MHPTILCRCPGITTQTLPTCSIWAADFAATGLHPPCNSTAILTYGPNDQYTVGAAVKYEGGARESLAFFFDCASWNTGCIALGHLAVTWMLRGIVPGSRMALLTPQVGLLHTRLASLCSPHTHSVQVQWRGSLLHCTCTACT